MIGSTQLYIHSSDRYISWYANGGNIVHSANDSILTNVWNHVAIVRSGSDTNNTSIYLNGTRVQQATNTATLGASSGTARIGSYTASGGNFDGYISNLRLLKGTALYSGSSITVPTSALTAITNTKLLTCQSNRFIDNSSTGFALTPVGNPAVSAFGAILTSSVYDPAVNGASAYLASGDSDYLQMPAQTIPTGSFTLEGWYYLTGTGQGQTVISQGSSGTSTRTFFGMEGNKFTFQMGGTVERGPTIFRNSWNHFACVYNSSYPFIQGWHNGVSTGATGYSGGDAENVAMQIGTLGSNWGSGYGLTGYVSDIRVSSGIKYTANNITVPTSPLAVQDSNTKLLLNMADGQAIDSAAQNNITLGGNANTSTDQAKFGNTSLHLDGTTDYAEIVNVQGFGTGDFTIEGFYRFASFTSQGNVFDFRTALNSALPLLYMNSSGELKYYLSGAVRIQAGSGNELSTNTWYHIALCRGSGSTKLFVDGTQVGSTYSDSTTYLIAPIVRIGARSYGSTPDQNIDGFVDDFRISRMARYTSNFTPDTEPFADKGQ